MTAPKDPVSLLKSLYKHVFPVVHTFLGEWKQRASEVPNLELRRQALASIETKTFHCEGGAVYSILAKESMNESVRFIVAYQTISDYLDNLCDRSTSLDPLDFRALHESMLHALTPGAGTANYYRFREEQDDGGYLEALVKTCQGILDRLDNYERIAPYLHELASYYCDLQVYKHIAYEERIPHLTKWFSQYRDQLPYMTWYEFSACTGSTLGIFCLVSYAFSYHLTDQQILQLKNGLFPYVQGLHILLDYFIDQEEDQVGGDLNFCTYYPSNHVMTERMVHFLKQADKHVEGLPDEEFHRLINRGLLGVYLSDQKASSQGSLRNIKRKILKNGGKEALFFYLNGRWYRKLLRKKLEINPIV
ncbi:tetraprenyl-beta-curcumene synthase family protein [Calidifontibacillus oryziterrae]|uniref:tetraprenyl-beta-curcumene synthase family protein n=1 Tax=Calidifontibacillus oryziterrae TaxID=1191699 RepID=UPI0002F96925|nr:tetraprenyl-beta-curcumene synthase family protein [Calidifontibacillus oryziterrae]